MEEAARVAGIGIQTLYRWLKQPAFKEEYLAARREVLSQASARLQQASSAAVSTLLKIMVDGNAPPAARVRAADRVLGHARQSAEIEDVLLRVAALERDAELAKSLNDPGGS